MIDFKKQVEADVARYEDMLKRFKSGQATSGEVDRTGWKTDTTPELVAHLERVLADLGALLADWPS